MLDEGFLIFWVFAMFIGGLASFPKIRRTYVAGKQLKATGFIREDGLIPGTSRRDTQLGETARRNWGNFYIFFAFVWGISAIGFIILGIIAIPAVITRVFSMF